MLEIEYTTQFKRDFKLIKRRHYKLELFEKVLGKLVKEEKLESKYKDHTLIRNWLGYRELHIQPDWLLIYEIAIKRKAIVLIRTGSHTDLFD